ncbi:zinc finger BED domain-containing protein 5 [Trichonephila clavipes]|nr:zinc finger BED domain-containing protein 5 [Trichonephila clavipes]
MVAKNDVSLAQSPAFRYASIESLLLCHLHLLGECRRQLTFLASVALGAFITKIMKDSPLTPLPLPPLPDTLRWNLITIPAHLPVYPHRWMLKHPQAQPVYLNQKIGTKKIMDKFLNRKRTFDDNKASTSAQTSIVPKIKSRKYSQEYLNFGFTITEVNGEEKPLCVICSKILAADSMKPNKLKRHFETLHTRCKKPHTIAEELILPAAIEIVETMFGDNFAKELQFIPLSNDTVSRRIDDIAEDVEQQLFGKLRDKLFSIPLDEATDSNKDAHFIAYVRVWDASYEWVRDPFQNTPEGLSTTEEEIFIDFTPSGEIKRQFCNKTLFQFWAEVDDEFSELKTKAFRILLPFSTSYLCETGFSAVAALKTKYRSQLNIEKEPRVSISNIKPSFENLCSARQAHGSH